MTRVIKFRAWDVDAELWRYFTLEDAIAGLLLNGVGRLMFKMDRKSQFIGLIDKNGKEIYEGDIVQWQNGGNDYFGDVYFEEGSFEVRGFYNSFQDEPGRAFSEHHPLWVRGNIYENPALLQ